MIIMIIHVIIHVLHIDDSYDMYNVSVYTVGWCDFDGHLQPHRQYRENPEADL